MHKYLTSFFVLIWLTGCAQVQTNNTTNAEVEETVSKEELVADSTMVIEEKELMKVQMKNKRSAKKGAVRKKAEFQKAVSKDSPAPAPGYSQTESEDGVVDAADTEMNAAQEYRSMSAGFEYSNSQSKMQRYQRTPSVEQQAGNGQGG